MISDGYFDDQDRFVFEFTSGRSLIEQLAGMHQPVEEPQYQGHPYGTPSEEANHTEGLRVDWVKEGF